MIDVAEAETRILQSMSQAPTETVPLAEANTRVLAQPVFAERDQPPFNRSMMDGYALQVNGRRDYRCVGVAAAGQAQQSLAESHQCIEIMTGAPLPEGSNCVVPVEQTQRDGEQVSIDRDTNLKAGQFVHQQASDHAADTRLLDGGTTIGPAEMAVLASAGLQQVPVRRKASVAVIASGDELVDVNQPILDHQIRRSNDYAVAALLERHHVAMVSRFHVADDESKQIQLMGRLIEQHDALVLTGGVSMGRYDYIPRVLESLGVNVVLHKVRQRPGKPMWFGVGPNGQAIFALPGNPVSALVCARRYVVPALTHRLSTSCRSHFAALEVAVEFAPALTLFMPATISSQLTILPRATNTSGDFASLAGTDGFIELAANRDQFAAGDVGRWFTW